MFTSESEARLEATKIATSENLDLNADPYVPIYNDKKQGWVLYPRVATLEVKAMRNGTYVGKDNCIFAHDDTGKLVSACTTIYRNLLDQKMEFSSDEVYLSEYATKKWHTDKPHMFLAKIALGRALRHAFPDLFGVQITYEEAMCELKFDSGVIKTNSTVKHDISKTPDFPARENSPKQEIPVATTNVTKLVAEVFGTK